MDARVKYPGVLRFRVTISGMALDDDDIARIRELIAEGHSTESPPVVEIEPPSPEEIRAAGEADAERIRAEGEADVARIEAMADADEQRQEASAPSDEPDGEDGESPDLDPADGDMLGVDATPRPQHWMERPLWGAHK